MDSGHTGGSRFRLSQIPTGCSSVVAVVTSVVSLVIAGASYLNTVRDPEVLLVMPEVVRVGSPMPYNDAQTIILQPTFISTAGNDRVEVMTELEVQVSRNGGGQPVVFRWIQSGVLSLSESTETVDYKFTSDPAPLLLTSTDPQQPVVYCDGPPGWTFDAGTYTITLVARRAVVSTPLRGVIRITVTPELAERLREKDGRIFRVETSR